MNRLARLKQAKIADRKRRVMAHLTTVLARLDKNGECSNTAAAKACQQVYARFGINLKWSDCYDIGVYQLEVIRDRAHKS